MVAIIAGITTEVVPAAVVVVAVTVVMVAEVAVVDIVTIVTMQRTELNDEKVKILALCLMRMDRMAKTKCGLTITEKRDSSFRLCAAVDFCFPFLLLFLFRICLRL